MGRIPEISKGSSYQQINVILPPQRQSIQELVNHISKRNDNLKLFDAHRRVLTATRLIRSLLHLMQKYSTAWLASKGLRDERIMTWPPSSPDLNPVENLWALLQH
ncbi:hypothetical protein L3Q82_023374, partial [Scortum barcoo]